MLDGPGIGRSSSCMFSVNPVIDTFLGTGAVIDGDGPAVAVSSMSILFADTVVEGFLASRLVADANDGGLEASTGLEVSTRSTFMLSDSLALFDPDACF